MGLVPLPALGVRAAAAVLAAMVVAWVFVDAAQASFPGGNGVIAVAVEGCSDNQHLRGFTPEGRSTGPLTAPCEPKPGEDGPPHPRSTLLPEWSPDGRTLAYVSAQADWMGLAFAAADGSAERRLPVRDPRTGAELAVRGRPSFSPDGRKVAIAARGSIWLADLETGDARLLRRPPRCRRTSVVCVAFTAPRWSPDGGVIAVRAYGRRLRSGRAAVGRGLWLIDAATGALIRRLAGSALEPDWAPDGRHLVYRTPYDKGESDGASGGDLHIVRRDGRARRTLVARRLIAETFPAWSPDGKSIAWVSLRFSGADISFHIKPSLWIVPWRGGEPQRLVGLPSLRADEIWFDSPQIAWQPSQAAAAPG